MKELIIIDMLSVVKDLGIENTVKIAESMGVLIWTSANGGKEPIVIKSEFGKFEGIKMVDDVIGIEKIINESLKETNNE